VYSPDIQLTGEESASALRALNALVDSLANENLTVNEVVVDNFNLVGGQRTYQWGIGSPDFTTQRPTSVKACTVAISGQSGNTDYPVILVQYDDYAAIKLKTLQTNYPQYVWLDGSYPYNNVTFYPVPSGATPVTFYSYKGLPEFSDLTEVLNLPQGYSQNIFDIASAARRSLAKTNYRPLTMQTEPTLMSNGGRYNIFSDRQGVA
jgi:hypothetical protein